MFQLCVIKHLENSGAAEHKSVCIWVCVWLVFHETEKPCKTKTHSPTFTGSGMYLTHICTATLHVHISKQLSNSQVLTSASDDLQKQGSGIIRSANQEGQSSVRFHWSSPSSFGACPGSSWQPPGSAWYLQALGFLSGFFFPVTHKINILYVSNFIMYKVLIGQ